MIKPSKLSVHFNYFATIPSNNVLITWSLFDNKHEPYYALRKKMNKSYMYGK